MRSPGFARILSYMNTTNPLANRALHLIHQIGGAELSGDLKGLDAAIRANHLNATQEMVDCLLTIRSTIAQLETIAGMNHLEQKHYAPKPRG